jgi:tetratricopeptide (TPR) repeat protein
MEKDFQSAEFSFNRGLAYYGKGDYDRAIDDYSAASKLSAPA